jgi:basic amino acid/polyamine antiporter, APA family
MSAPTPPGAFQQKIGLFDATMLVAGSMIGSGIFIVSAGISRDVGSSGWLLGIWILTGLITIMGALSYAELAAMMPRAGGQYVYIREAYGPLCGFLYGWTFFLVIQTGFIAAVSVAFAKYLGVLVPSLGTDSKPWSQGLSLDYKLPVPWLPEQDWPSLFNNQLFAIGPGQLVAVGVAVVLTAINCFGIQAGKLVQNVFTITKLLSLAMLIVLGLTIAFEPETLARNFTNIWDGIWSTEQFAAVNKIVPSTGLAAAMVVAAAMVGSLFSADSWNNVTFTAGETKDPQRNLPRSLVLGTVIVITLYVLANVAYLAALPIRGDLQKAEAIEAEAKSYGAGSERARELEAQAAFIRGIDHAKDDRVGTAVLERASPKLGVPLMAIAIMISTFGCVNGLVLMGPRLYYAMAQDGVFFQSVGRLSSRGVPAAGLVFQCLWSIVLIFSGTYSDLLDYTIFAALLFYAVTVAGLFILRWTQPNVERPYRALGYPVVPALYVVLCTVIMLVLLVVKPVYSWPSFLIVLAGIPVYLMWRTKETPQSHKEH